MILNKHEARAFYHIVENPGIGVPDLIDKTGLNLGSIYRILHRLAQKGLIRIEQESKGTLMHLHSTKSPEEFEQGNNSPLELDSVGETPWQGRGPTISDKVVDCLRGNEQGLTFIQLLDQLGTKKASLSTAIHRLIRKGALGSLLLVEGGRLNRYFLKGQEGTCLPPFPHPISLTCEPKSNQPQVHIKDFINHFRPLFPQISKVLVDLEKNTVLMSYSKEEEFKL